MADETPADDLRSLLSQSFDQASPAASDVAADTKPAKPEPIADATPAEDTGADTAATTDGDRPS